MTLSSMSSAPLLPIPPEAALFAIGLFVTAWLLLTTLLCSTSVLAKRLSMPPEFASLAADVRDGVEPAVLFVTRVLVSVRTPPLSIPPPLLNPHARAPQNPGGMNEFDITVL